MSVFSLEASIARAEGRLRHSRRQTRSDRGETRAVPEVEAKLRALLLQPDRPPMTEVGRELSAFCLERGVRPLSRASLYNALGRLPVPALERAGLPEAIRQSLYNLGEPSAMREGASIPGDQVVFYAFNYGSIAAISFASGLPWLCLYRAARRPGWRPKSRALLDAVMKYRGI